MKNERDHFKVYVTKYALSTGIIVISDVEWCTDISEQMVSYKLRDNNITQILHSPDWHRTPETALARAEEMRQAKIKSIKKQLTKLEKLEFIITE